MMEAAGPRRLVPAASQLVFSQQAEGEGVPAVARQRDHR